MTNTSISGQDIAQAAESSSEPAEVVTPSPTTGLEPAPAAKHGGKHAPKHAGKSRARTVQVPEVAVGSGKVAKAGKLHKPVLKKPRLVRDSFTFPEADYALIAALKARVLGAGREIKKNEVLRAGLIALAAMPDEDLLKAVDGVEKIKTGRPAKLA